MIGTTAVVVDSAAYLPQSLIERHGVLVAPLTVVLDGHEYLEGIDISASSPATPAPPRRTIAAITRKEERHARHPEAPDSLTVGCDLGGSTGSGGRCCGLQW